MFEADEEQVGVGGFHFQAGGQLSALIGGLVGKNDADENTETSM